MPLLLLLAGVAIGLMSMSASPPERDLAKATDEIQRSTRQLTIVRRATVEAQQTLMSAEAVSDQPDWSILLAIVAQSQGESIVLNRCELTPIKDGTPIAPPAATPVQAVSF